VNQDNKLRLATWIAGVFVSAAKVVLRYRNLLAVEDAFKTAKALLTTRPIFHKTDAGIRGHVFCTFLALVLRKELIGPPLSNGSASSTISPISAKSTSNRTAAGPDCAPLPARPSTRSAAPSALPYRPSSRRCRPSPEPRLWCLKRRMARKPLIINVVQIETAEVGFQLSFHVLPFQSKRNFFHYESTAGLQFSRTHLPPTRLKALP
jgi:hypothetical protein